MIKRFIASCCAAMLLCLSTVGVSASSGSNSVSLSYRIDNAPIQGVEFSIYDIGDIDSSTREIVYNDTFSGYNVSTSLDDSIASTLQGYAQRDNLDKQGTNSTDIEGICTFSGLDAGLYLITGGTYESKGYSYYVQPVLANVPCSGVLEVKHEAVPSDGKEKVKSVSVRKVWDSDRVLSSISVDLLKDGKLYKTVELSNKNNWSYTWRNLPSKESYSVVESKVPEGYKVKTKASNGEWVITNKQNGVLNNPASKPGLDSTSINTQYTGKLPQTGMHHIEVLVLCVLSVVFGVAGIVIVKSTGKNR